MKQLPLIKQAWTIAKIELRRAFFSKRAFWVYGLALFPTIIFLGHAATLKFRASMLSNGDLIPPALMDSIREGETADAIVKRLGKPSSDYEWEQRQRIRNKNDDSGITTHRIGPEIEARYVRLSILQPTYTGDPTARIYEFELYGKDNINLALNRPATGSKQCSDADGPEKAFNGNVQDNWCSRARSKFLQVDLGEVVPLDRIVLKHASASGQQETLNTRAFNVQVSSDNKKFETVVNTTGARLVEEITAYRRLAYFDGIREAKLEFSDGKLTSKNVKALLNFEEDRSIFAGVFQLFYLRLAIFFGCLGIFMNLFRGEMLDKTLHYWFLAPAKREVLLIGKYGAGLFASSIIFTGGALLCFSVVMASHNSAEVEAYLQGAGMGHAFWYMAAAALGCIGYGSVFLATGLLLRNPIIPAAILLGWESINSFLPEILQKLSILHYLQSLCPVPIPVDDSVPGLMQLLLVPAAPASRTSAVLGLFAVTAVVLWIAGIVVRRMEITYGTE